MIKLFGEIYYIDFEVIDVFLNSDSSLRPGMIEETEEIFIYNDKDEVISRQITKNTTQKPREINGVRFDIIRGLISDLGDGEEDDSKNELGTIKLEDMNIRFKLAFNTLTAYQILKPIED